MSRCVHVASTRSIVNCSELRAASCCLGDGIEIAPVTNTQEGKPRSSIKGRSTTLNYLETISSSSWLGKDRGVTI